MQKWKYLATILGFFSCSYSLVNAQNTMWWSTYCPYPLDKICSFQPFPEGWGNGGNFGIRSDCATTINNNGASAQIDPLAVACGSLVCLENSTDATTYGCPGGPATESNAHEYCQANLQELSNFFATRPDIFTSYSGGSGANTNYSELSSYMNNVLNIDINAIYTQCLTQIGATLGPGDPFYVAPATQAPATSAPATAAPTSAPTQAPSTPAPVTAAPTSAPTTSTPTAAPAAPSIVCTLTNQGPSSPNPCSLNTPSCSALCNLYSAANVAADHCVGSDALNSCRALWEAIAQYASASNTSPHTIVSFLTGGYDTFYEGSTVFNASDSQLYLCNGYCTPIPKGGIFHPHPSGIPAWQKPLKIRPTSYTPWTKAEEAAFFQKARAQRLRFEAYIKAQMRKKHSSLVCSPTSSHDECIKSRKG